MPAKNFQAFLKSLCTSLKIKRYLYSILFWFFTIFGALFTFFASLMSTIKLAADKIESLDFISKFFRVNQYKENGEVVVVDLWPIMAVWVGVVITLCSGLLSFFVIRQKWIETAKKSNAILLEIELYKQRLGKYNVHNPEYQLMKKVFYITDTNRFYINRKRQKNSNKFNENN